MVIGSVVKRLSPDTLYNYIFWKQRSQSHLLHLSLLLLGARVWAGGVFLGNRYPVIDLHLAWWK